MQNIIQKYVINESTLALLPAREIEYDTVVLKEDKQPKHIRQTAFNLIKSACYEHDLTTYDGRRDAVVKQTGFIQKTPIPVSILRKIYFFPTRSPYHPDNIWLALQHILEFGRVPREEATKDAQSFVNFKNGQELNLDISIHTLKTQYYRALECVTHVEGDPLRALKILYPY